MDTATNLNVTGCDSDFINNHKIQRDEFDSSIRVCTERLCLQVISVSIMNIKWAIRQVICVFSTGSHLHAGNTGFTAAAANELMLTQVLLQHTAQICLLCVQ